MKTALITFKPCMDAVNVEQLNGITNLFADGKMCIDTLEVLSQNDDLGFIRRLEEFKETADLLIIVDNQSTEFDIKTIIAEKTDSVLTENENAKKFLDEISKKDGKIYPEEFAFMPIDATVIPNTQGAYQGFMLEANDFAIAVLPSDLKQFGSMCEQYVFPYIESKLGINSKKLTLKYVGDQDKLYLALEKAFDIAEKTMVYSVKEDNGDYTVNIFFDESVAKKLSSDAIRFIISELKDNIYAESNISLRERLFDLLKLKKLKLSVAESFTGGRVVADMINNAGASEYVYEGIVAYNSDSKVKRLGVSGMSLAKNGAVSSVVAYEMALGLLMSGKCDLAIATTGIAGPTSDDSNKPVGLCYIAIGMKDGVHTYKYNLVGSREQITETAKNTALFLAIKKIKNI